MTKSKASRNKSKPSKASKPATFHADTKAHCGTIVTIGHDGEPQLISGLLSKEDAAQLAKNETPAEEEAAADESTTDQPQAAYSAVLVESLTAVKTASIAAELSQQPNVALAAVVHALVLSQFALDLRLYRSRGCLQIQTTQPHLAEAADSQAVQSLSQQQTAWLKRLPKTPKALWQWCLSASTDTLLSLLAFCSALSLNAVQRKNDTDAERIHHADALATALKIDMRNWFTPTAANFFSKVSKTRIFDAMSEAGKADDARNAANLKKGPLAEFAETTLKGTGWLPEPIRIAPERPEDTTFAQDDENEEVNHTEE